MTKCEFAISGLCQISTEMAGIHVPLHEGACKACLALADAKRPGNHVVTDRACWTLRLFGQHEKAYAVRLASDKNMVARVTSIDAGRAERRKRAIKGKERKLRLLSWLKLFRIDGEEGIGDTANRLRQQRKKSPIWIASDAHDAIKRLLAQCSCSRTEAVTRLNKEYPY